jgi:hypothetical protein
VTKLISTLALIVAAVVALGAVGPGLARLIAALVPLVLVVGVVASVLLLVRYFTRS